MNRTEYLSELENALSGLPREEIKKSLDFYAEMLDDAVENGETEEAAIARLGSVEETAQKIINETPLARLVKENVKKHSWSGAEIALIIILSPLWVPLAAAAIAVVTSLYLAIWAIAAAMFTVCAGFAVGGLVLLAATPFFAASDIPKAALSLGIGLILTGGSVFVFFASLAFSKLIIRLTAYIVRKIKNRFIGKEMRLQ